VSEDDQHAQREALKRTAVALKEAGVPFALGGGYAAWALGGPEPAHDVDFVVAEADAPRTEQVLSQAGLRVERPPEDWLFKVFADDAMVDIIFRVGGVSVEAPLLRRAAEMEVLSVRMPVLDATDVLASKLNALDEHDCDFASEIPVARALREQVDWERLRRDVEDNDFAVAFLFLLQRMGIIGGS
jgi:predicted nucleotidyltransferase